VIYNRTLSGSRRGGENQNFVAQNVHCNDAVLEAVFVILSKMKIFLLKEHFKQIKAVS